MFPSFFFQGKSATKLPRGDIFIVGQMEQKVNLGKKIKNTDKYLDYNMK